MKTPVDVLAEFLRTEPNASAEMILGCLHKAGFVVNEVKPEPAKAAHKVEHSARHK